jgi:hypothetical protein
MRIGLLRPVSQSYVSNPFGASRSGSNYSRPCSLRALRFLAEELAIMGAWHCACGGVRLSGMSACSRELPNCAHHLFLAQRKQVHALYRRVLQLLCTLYRIARFVATTADPARCSEWSKVPNVRELFGQFDSLNPSKYAEDPDIWLLIHKPST